MASSKTKRGASAVDPTAIEAELQRARDQLAAEGALKLAGLKPKSARDAVVARLSAEGFETNKSWLRRPLADQLRDALSHGATVDKKSLASLLRGASAPEVSKALAEAEGRGELRRVLRGKAEAFSSPDTPVLEPRQLSALRAVLSSLEKTLAGAIRKKGVSLLASDVEQALAEAQRVLEPRAADGSEGRAAGSGRATAGTRREPDLQPVLAALDATKDERTGLSFVPKLVARLLPDMTVAVAQDVLLRAARSELIELRPEGGLGRLSAEELRLCPPGPGGTRLSWARRLSGGVA